MDAALWQARHRGITLLLWGHVLALPVLATLRGHGLRHVMLESALLSGFAVAASVRRLRPTVRFASATLGLVTSSAFLVHLFDGLGEAHFHFFVVVAVVSLYHAWVPFLLAVSFVLAHHTVLGLLAPALVYDHAAAQEDPASWAAVHALLLMAECVACLASWRLAEDALDREREAGRSVERAHDDLVRAQKLARIGSWDWDVRDGSITWSEQFYGLLGLDPRSFTPTLQSVLELVHEEDSLRVAAFLEEAVRGQTLLDLEYRLRHADGSYRTMYVLADPITDENGAVVQMHGTCQDVTEQSMMQEEITRLAFHDPLTGLPNRRLFMTRLEEVLAGSSSTGRDCAVVFVDLDAFKEVNDTHGHAVGDAVLAEVARRLEGCVRQQDTVARLGGDEFAVLCADSGPEDVQRVAERIAAQVCGPASAAGVAVTIEVSLGFATAGGADGTDPDALLRGADHAMYAAKDLSRRARVSPTPAVPAARRSAAASA